MAKIGDLVAELKMDGSNFEAGVKSANSSVDDFEQNIQAASVTAGASFAAISAATMKFGQDAANLETIQAGFARNFAGNAEENLRQLQEAADGTITSYDLMLSANRASLLGVADNTEQLADLLETARLRAREMGLTTTQAFNDIVTGIGRGSPLILDNLGIVIPEAVKEMGASMDEAGRKQLLLESVLKDGASIAAEYGEITLTSAEKIQAMRAGVVEATTSLGAGLLPILLQAGGVFSTVVGEIGRFVNNNRKLVEIGAKTALIITGVVTAVGAFMLAAKTATAVAASFAAMLKLVGLSASSAFGPLGLIAGALGIATVSSIDFSGGAAQAAAETNKMSKAMENSAKASRLMSIKMEKSMKGASEGVQGVGNAIQGVQKQIDEANRQFDRDLAEVVRRRRNQIEDNKQMLKEEKREFEKQQEDITRSYQESTKRIKEEQSARVKALEKSMQETLQVGSSTYDRDVENFREAIEREKEIETEKLEEAKNLYEEETQQIRFQYEERTSALQQQIDEDTALLEKHSEVIRNIKLEEAQDEIEILIATHEERLRQLNKQLGKERGAYSNHIGQVGGMYEDLFNNIASGEDSITDPPELEPEQMFTIRQGRTVTRMPSLNYANPQQRTVNQTNNIYNNADLALVSAQLSLQAR